MTNVRVEAFFARASEMTHADSILTPTLRQDPPALLAERSGAEGARTRRLKARRRIMRRTVVHSIPIFLQTGADSADTRRSSR
jgi:hypothetical protein